VNEHPDEALGGASVSRDRPPNYSIYRSGLGIAYLVPEEGSVVPEPEVERNRVDPASLAAIASEEETVSLETNVASPTAVALQLDLYRALAPVVADEMANVVRSVDRATAGESGMERR
jgi:hypothetical protein